ncbi:MAG: ubiquitin carboxyl-terminal hydrolase [Candidatus Rhabdochlamydia sp.]
MAVANSTNSFFTAKSYVSNTTYSSVNKSPLINLNGKLYELKVYHKKPDADWEEITDSYLKLAKGIDFQEIIQQIKVPYKKIEIQTSIYPNTNSICNIQDTDGTTRKIAGFNLTESQNTKIFQILKKINLLREVSQSRATVKSSLLSKKSLENLNSSFIAMSLEEIKEERTRSYLEQAALFNQPIKELEKPIYKPVGFKNKSMNCGFNSCLQMILNEPALVDVYRTVAAYYKAQSKKEDKSCGEKLLSVLEAYDQAVKKQKPISEEVSNKFRLAVHYLSAGMISSKSSIQEDANEILMILFSKYEHIIQNQEIISFLQNYRNALKAQKDFKIPSHLKSIVAGKNITQDLLDEMIKERRQMGEESLLNMSLMHYEMEHIVHHKIEKIISNPVNTDYSILTEDDTLIKKHIELDLKIKFNPKQQNLTLINLLQSHFSHGAIEGSEPRKFVKNKDCVEASIIKEELKFGKLPEHLFISLERFVPNWENPKKPTKFTNPIEIPEQLDAKLLKKDASNQKYELSSFIVHIGQTINGGHYIAYRKVKDQWVKCNDGDISYPSKEEMLTAAKNSYICFYKLKNDI